MMAFGKHVARLVAPVRMEPPRRPDELDEGVAPRVERRLADVDVPPVVRREEGQWSRQRPGPVDSSLRLRERRAGSAHDDSEGEQRDLRGRSCTVSHADALAGRARRSGALRVATCVPGPRRTESRPFGRRNPPTSGHESVVADHGSVILACDGFRNASRKLKRPGLELATWKCSTERGATFASSRYRSGLARCSWLWWQRRASSLRPSSPRTSTSRLGCGAPLEKMSGGIPQNDGSAAGSHASAARWTARHRAWRQRRTVERGARARGGARHELTACALRWRCGRGASRARRGRTR